MKRYAIATVAFLFLVAPWRQTSTADQAAYTVETLGTSSNIDNLVPSETGINASGQVSGYVTDSTNRKRAVRYEDGTGWEYVPGLTWGSDATGINVHGDIVGTRLVGGFKHAYRYNAYEVRLRDLRCQTARRIGPRHRHRTRRLERRAAAISAGSSREPA